MTFQIELKEEEREFLHRVVERAVKLAWLVENNSEAIKDSEKAELLLAKLDKKVKGDDA